MREEREEAISTAVTVRVHKYIVFNLLCQLVHKFTNKEKCVQYLTSLSPFPFSCLNKAVMVPL